MQGQSIAPKFHDDRNGTKMPVIPNDAMILRSVSPLDGKETSILVEHVSISNVNLDREYGCVEARVKAKFRVHWSDAPIYANRFLHVLLRPNQTATERRFRLIRNAIRLTLAMEFRMPVPLKLVA